MAFSLRLPPALDLEARKRADQIGVPLNGLICFALDLYLRGGGVSAPSETIVDDLDFQNPRRVSLGGMPLKIPQSLPVISSPGGKLSKAQRREITASARLARKAV